MGLLQVIAGGQYGSEAKGAVAAYLARETRPPLFGIRVGGPNAGHTVIGRCPHGCTTSGKDEWPDHPVHSHPWRLRQIPVAAVANPEAKLLIAAGSEIDIPVLEREVDELDAAGYRVSSRLMIDREATIIEDGHKNAEKILAASVGSTGKGIGAARANRLMRDASRVCNRSELARWMIDSSVIVQNWVATDGLTVQIEGTQGYGLGLHAGEYPFATAGDCRAIDFMAQAGVLPWTASRLEVWVVYRVYPIRVGGNSGPMYQETSWADLGLKQEYTTVTGKIRRVGHWDDRLARKSARANGAGHPDVHCALTMADQAIPSIAGFASIDKCSPQERADLTRLMGRVHDSTSMWPELVGTGPATMMDLRDHRG